MTRNSRRTCCSSPTKTPTPSRPTSTLRRRVPNLCAEEQEEFASVRFSYPRTRKQLLTLMEHAAKFERAAAGHCQSRILYGLRLGVRETLEDGATKIAEAVAGVTLDLPRTPRPRARTAPATARTDRRAGPARHITTTTRFAEAGLL
jgi:hypothetical protein